MNEAGPNRILSVTLSLVLDIVLGVFAHYLLYRIALPTQPFIYAAF